MLLAASREAEEREREREMHQTADASSKNPHRSPAHTRHVIPSRNHANQSPSYVLTQSLYPNPNPCERLDVNHKTADPNQTLCTPGPTTRGHRDRPYITTPATHCQAPLTPRTPHGPDATCDVPAHQLGPDRAALSASSRGAPCACSSGASCPSWSSWLSCRSCASARPSEPCPAPRAPGTCPTLGVPGPPVQGIPRS